MSPRLFQSKLGAENCNGFVELVREIGKYCAQKPDLRMWVYNHTIQNAAQNLLVYVLAQDPCFTHAKHGSCA